MQMITFKDLRSMLGGRGRSTIYRDVEEGRLPKPVKVGGRLYWKRADIEQLLAGDTPPAP